MYLFSDLAATDEHYLKVTRKRRVNVSQAPENKPKIKLTDYLATIIEIIQHICPVNQGI